MLINGLTAFHLFGAAVNSLLHDICQNCTSLTIETTPGLVSRNSKYTKKWWFAVPYPSAFHWSENIKQNPWKYDKERSLFILCIGSVKTFTAESTRLRRMLFKQCNEKSDELCQWHSVSHASLGVCTFIVIFYVLITPIRS